jgi:uncharacterized protein with FMN-binding domain
VRRAIAAIVLTVAGLFLLLDYKSSPVARSPSRVSALGALPVPGSGPTTSNPLITIQPPAGDGATPTLPTPSTGVAPVPNKSPNTAVRTVTGPVITTPYGDVQVAVTLSGSRITDVNAVALPADRSRSRAISQYAAPILHDETLAAQGAQIDSVSGASYTSQGYAESLQAALTQASG